MHRCSARLLVRRSRGGSHLRACRLFARGYFLELRCDSPTCPIYRLLGEVPVSTASSIMSATAWAIPVTNGAACSVTSQVLSFRSETAFLKFSGLPANLRREPLVVRRSAWH